MVVAVSAPITNEEIKERTEQYPLLTPKRFATKFNDLLFKPVQFQWNGISNTIQVNQCTNPYCKWFGMGQEKFPVKGKPSRYKLSGTGESKTIKCNPDPVHPTRGMTLDCHTRTFSNWSVAEEISRLVSLETVKEVEPRIHSNDISFTKKFILPPTPTINMQVIQLNILWLHQTEVSEKWMAQLIYLL